MTWRDILRFLGTYAVILAVDAVLSAALDWPRANGDKIFMYAMFCTTLWAVREVGDG